MTIGKFWLGSLLALAPLTAAGAQTAPTAQPTFATAPFLPGAWSYRAIPGGSEAAFLDTAGIRRLVVQCALASRQISLSLTSTVPAQSMFVWTSTASRTIAARYDQGGFQVIAPLAARDPLLDAIAFSRGRFALSVPGSLAVVLSSQPEPARAIEDCRI